jgi:uncharacterized membrane protein/glutaredoxin
MSRRRSTPWIHRSSRFLITAIALLGAVNTGYLTATKLLGRETACPTSGCEQVLSGPYATVFGLPLALFGLLAYTSVAVMAAAPLLVNSETQKKLRANLEAWTWPLLFAIATSMMIFSGYLMYIMVTKYILVYGSQGICFYCIASALFATSLFVLTLLGRAWEDVGQLFFIGIVVGMITLIATLGIYGKLGKSASLDSGSGTQAIQITTTSSQAEIALAQHLKQIGAKMYGAYWCPHCHDQKQLFGKEAFSNITYIECDPSGKNAQPDLCKAAKIESYPTWEINGKLYSGTQPLEQLATASGYKGPQNFKNSSGP